MKCQKDVHTTTKQNKAMSNQIWSYTRKQQEGETKLIEK